MSTRIVVILSRPSYDYVTWYYPMLLVNTLMLSFLLQKTPSYDLHSPGDPTRDSWLPLAEGPRPNRPLSDGSGPSLQLPGTHWDDGVIHHGAYFSIYLGWFIHSSWFLSIYIYMYVCVCRMCVCVRVCGMCVYAYVYIYIICIIYIYILVDTCRSAYICIHIPYQYQYGSIFLHAS